MDHFARLHLIGKVTYYLGWIALLCGGLVQINIARSLFIALRVSERNLLELSVVCFLICMASELRAIALSRGEISKEIPAPAKARAAA